MPFFTPKNFYSHTVKAHYPNERGQVLILTLMALLLIVIAILIVFDVQNVLRGKVKIQNSVDAAALAGAEWQKNTLNLIGELNLVRATGVLISDPFFGIGDEITEYTKVPPPETFYDGEGKLNTQYFIQELIRVDKEKKRLSVVDSLISQLQTRIAFVGPMIGFGAAQQAAKNNGMNYNEEAGEMFSELLGLMYRNDLYGNEAIAPQLVYDFSWRGPYIGMLQSVMDYSAGEDASGHLTNHAYGIAVGTTVDFIGAPTLSAEPPSVITGFLGNKHFYDSIHGRNWCELKEILEHDFVGNWWGNFKTDYNNKFSMESEILPVNISFNESQMVYDNALSSGALNAVLDNIETPVSDIFDEEAPYPYSTEEKSDLKKDEKTGTIIRSHIITVTPTGGDQGIYNSSDTDLRYNILPLLNWATFNEKWERYSDEVVNDWRRYLRGDFKKGADYYSGALSYFEGKQRTRLITGKNRLSSSKMARNDLDIKTDALAKPIGYIQTDDGEKLRPFEAGGMVFPVFHEVALIPIALEEPSGFNMNDLDWYYFLIEYIPILGESSSLDEAWQKASERHPHHIGYFSYYHNALKILDSEDFRQQGINWLNKPVSWATDSQGNKYPTEYNKDHCDDWWSVGEGGTRRGPSSLH